jgi:hypothetical protein
MDITTKVYNMHINPQLLNYVSPIVKQISVDKTKEISHFFAGNRNPFASLPFPSD